MNIEQELKEIGLTFEQYSSFLEDCSNKINKLSDLNWQDIIDKYGLNVSVDMLRKAQAFRPYGGAFVREFMLYQNKIRNTENTTDKDMILTLEQKERDIYIAKRKLQDERNELNKILRDHARLEENEKILFEELTSLSNKRYPELQANVCSLDSEHTIVVCLSDLHIGANWDNVGGQFNTQIAKQRLGTYLTQVFKIQEKYQASKCIVCVLGDCISGNIHKTIAVSNRENVIQQVKLACELITDFVYELKKYFNNIEMHCVSGNHSRVEIKKEDSLLAERLDNLIPWFAGHMLKKSKGIRIVQDEPDETISRFEIGENAYFMVHGDFDGMNVSAIENLSMYMGEIPYAVLMGHKHFPAMSSVSGIKVIQCGSLCGSGDEFTRKNRLFDDPSQTVLVCNNDGIVSMYPVNLA